MALFPCLETACLRLQNRPDSSTRARVSFNQSVEPMARSLPPLGGLVLGARLGARQCPYLGKSSLAVI